MSLSVESRPRLIGDRTRQSAQIQSVVGLSEILINDLFNLVIKRTGEIPEENKPIVLESICALNTALVMLYETIQQGD